MKSVIFICNSNRFRSIVAQAYMQNKINLLASKNDYFIDSAGIRAIVDLKPKNEHIELLKIYNIDIENYYSKNISNIYMNEYNLIVCMTIEQKKELITIYPKLKNEIYTLEEYSEISIKDLNVVNKYSDEKIVKIIFKCIDNIIKVF